MLGARMTLRGSPRKTATVFRLVAVLLAAGAGILGSALFAPRALAADVPVLADRISTEAALAALGMIVQPSGFFLPGKMISPGEVAKAHAFFDTTDKCEQCHDKSNPAGYKVAPNDRCTTPDCHAADIGNAQKKSIHFHGTKLVTQRTCGECHYDHKGLGFDMVNDPNPAAEINGARTAASPWGVAMQRADGSVKNWDHNLTGYKLVGGHKIDCDKCHKPTDTRPKSQTRTWLGLQQECLACHDNYHHFPKGDKFEDCLVCHTFNSWKKEFNLKGFDHDKTNFALHGAHAKVLCDKCHAKGKPFAPLPHETCETCHLSDSPHGKTFTTKQCVFCHTETSWKSGIKVQTSEHKKFAKYDAQGAHARLGCQVCHKGLKTTPSAPGAADGNCTSCHNNIHSDKWMQSVKLCTKCHSQERWTPATVKNEDHKNFSSWNLLKGDPSETPVNSRHLQLQCIRCHADLKVIPEQHDCAFCHQDFHLKVEKRTNGPKCEECHATNGWGRASFNHDKFWPLTGKHKGVGCEQCHSAMKQGLPANKVEKECMTCHKSPHLGKLPDTCDKCHTTGDWRGAEGFDHNRDSKFHLSGRHNQVGCYVCHLDLGFRGTPQTCAQCHSDYHKGAWGSTGCQECHNEKRWQVDKHTLVFQSLHNFGEVVLTGQHERLACEVCHDPNPRWLMSGFGGECNTCHPDVHLGGRGQECYRCHNQNQWLPAQFDHSSTGFPLYGTHRLVACAECHKGNQYAGLPDECVFCHTEDGAKGHGPTLNNSLNNGNIHCSDCHTATTWLVALPAPGRQ